jgi:hypothetical protein
VCGQRDAKFWFGQKNVETEQRPNGRKMSMHNAREAKLQVTWKNVQGRRKKRASQA